MDGNAWERRCLENPRFATVSGIVWQGLKMVRGARGRNRTADTVIFSHVLYQLSYPGIACC